MNHVNYAVMSDQELRQYFLRHREDKLALQAYLDRLNAHSRKIVTTVNDPKFDAKIQGAILQQMQATDSDKEAAV